MCLRVDANGWGDGAGTHVSVVIDLMQGEYDDSLLWPLRVEIMFQLINQKADGGHVEHTIEFGDSVPDSVAGQVTEGERAPTGWGMETFIPHSALQCDEAWNTEYIVRDSLEFRVTEVKVVERLPVLTAHQPWSQPHPPVPPTTMVMRGFISWKMRDCSWFSPSFYSHIGGYKMCLGVNANGGLNGTDTHVAVGVHLMRGEYDNDLTWPFRAHVAIQLVNHKTDEGNVNYTSCFIDSTPEDVSCRVTEGERAPHGWGLVQFISHYDLGFGRNTEFLNNDTLEFRVISVNFNMTEL